MRVSDEVVAEVARRESTEPEALDPLYDSINPEALDEIFRSRQQSGRIVFSYMDYEVVVTGDGRVALE